MFLDTFFLFEILYNFFVGIERRGVYIDDHWTVVCTYVSEQFLFDLVTSIPGSSCFSCACLYLASGKRLEVRLCGMHVMGNSCTYTTHPSGTYIFI